jgi:hypothetical protein
MFLILPMYWNVFIVKNFPLLHVYMSYLLYLNSGKLTIVVTYIQFDSNIRVLYVFKGLLKKYGPKYAEW